MNHAPDLIAATIKMVLSLAVVLGLLWMLTRWIRRAQPGGAAAGRGRLIKVLGSHYLGMKKSIALVKVPGTILVLGIGSDRVNLLTRIDDPAVIAGIETGQEGDSGVGFRDQLQRMMRPFSARAEQAARPTSSDGVL
ncbi:MAG: flagellar biosynthetic protein FliO [Desulfobacteraceae bacterium]|nr:MAG: flagellar biosynthetic protein FliO [Desulfobacteraceae bacterium]